MPPRQPDPSPQDADRAPAANSSQELLQTLADGCRILALEGQGDIIWGHVTCRVPDADGMLYMKPAAMGLDEITPDDIITINLDGQQTAGTRPVHSEVFIHTEIMRARPEVTCVVHTHPPHAVAFGATGQPLLPIGHEGSYFVDGLPVFTQTSDLIVTRARGAALATALGAHSAALLRNHGLVAVGRTIAEAVMTALLLEKACSVQLLADQYGGAAYWTDTEEARIKRQRIYREAGIAQAFDYYVRRVRGQQQAH